MTAHQSFAPGQVATNFEVGDFILCHRKGLVAACIRLGQHLRYGKAGQAYTYWSHAALVVSEQGDLVEALTRGVVRSHIDKYKHVEYTLVHPGTFPLDRLQIVSFANQVVGEKYGWITIASEALSLAPGWHLTLGVDGQCICSGLVARARERAGDFFKDPADVQPAGLALYFKVIRPKDTPKYAPSNVSKGSSK